MIYFYLIGSKQKIHSFAWKPPKIKNVVIVPASSKFNGGNIANRPDFVRELGPLMVKYGINEKIKATTMKSLGEYMIKELLSKLK